MRGRMYCGGNSDFKMVCPECWSRFFLPKDSINQGSLVFPKFDVICPHCGDGLVTLDLKAPEREWWGAAEHLDDGPKKKDICDIIYVEKLDLANEFRNLIKSELPDIKSIEEDHDYIHEYRLLVNVPGEHAEKYIAFIVANGFMDISFYIQLSMGMKGRDFLKYIRDCVRKFHPEALKNPSERFL